MKQLIVFFLLLPCLSFSQSARKDSLWSILKPFIGVWAGEGGGEPGKGQYERSYQFIMDRNFIEIKNRSTYPPSANNPKGEVHEDIGYFSYDKTRKKFKLRQFHIEAFVNTFVLDSISADKKVLVFISEDIENIPKGFRAKETYRLLGDNEIEEIFEIAEPGKDFSVYTKVRLVRLKQ